MVAVWEPRAGVLLTEACVAATIARARSLGCGPAPGRARRIVALGRRRCLRADEASRVPGAAARDRGGVLGGIAAARAPTEAPRRAPGRILVRRRQERARSLPIAARSISGNTMEAASSMASRIWGVGSSSASITMALRRPRMRSYAPSSRPRWNRFVVRCADLRRMPTGRYAGRRFVSTRIPPTSTS